MPGQWQGKYTCIRVIGDAQGSALPQELLRNARGTKEKLSWLRRVAGGGSLKFVHVLRNPFDEIATMAWRELGNDDASTESAPRVSTATPRIRFKHRLTIFCGAAVARGQGRRDVDG